MIEGALGESRELDLEFALVGPPDLWLEQGLEPPAHLTTEARLRIRPTSSVVMTRRERTVPDIDCSDIFEIGLESELELPELGSSSELSGVISVDVSDEATSGDVPAGSIVLKGDSVGRCDVSGAPEVDVVFSCFPEPDDDSAPMVGMRSCLDPEQWVETPLEVGQTGRSTFELVEQLSNAFPMTLSCGCSTACSDSPAADPTPQSLSLRFSATLPERYCPVPDWFSSDPIPALGRRAVGDEAERYGRIGFTLRDDGIFGSHVSIRIDDTGALIVEAREEWLVEDVDGNGFPWTCSGQRVLE